MWGLDVLQPFEAAFKATDKAAITLVQVTAV
jgi:hypothetical protein